MILSVNAFLPNTSSSHGKLGVKGYRPAEPLPTTYRGYPVIDADRTDLRFGDRSMDTGAPPTGGYWVGLRAKGKAKKDSSTTGSGFVVPQATAKARARVSDQDPMMVTSWGAMIPDSWIDYSGEDA